MKYALVLIMAIGLSACGGKQSDKAEVGLGWSPQTVKVECPSGDCPDAAGLLIFGRRGGRGYQLSRCTATLIASDTIITNSHCDDSLPDHTHAYFIKSGGAGQPVVVANVVRKTYDQQGAMSGIDRDLAIFKLDRAMPGSPKSISRRIPQRMEQLIAYVIDQSYWDSDFQSFNLNKRVCQTQARMALFAGGTEDKSLGVALFNCEVKHGNSGSAVYVPGDMQNIQGLMNTLWTFSSSTTQSAAKLRALFFETPVFMKKDYGMAERLHCADVPDQAPPEEYCTKVTMEMSVAEKFREAVRQRVDQSLQTLASGAGGAEWTIETLVGEMSAGYGSAAKFPAVYLVPVPFCLKGTPAAVTMNAQYFRVGLLDPSGAEARMLYQDELTSILRPGSGEKVEILSSWQRGNGPRFEPSVPMIRRHTELSGNFRSQNLKPCDYASRLEAREKAIDNANRAIRLQDPRFARVPN